jgi:hypothetical protein
LVRGRKSKKDRIIELMDKGKSAKEVADMVGTSESYVNKVKSIERMESAISSNSKSEDLFIPTNADVEFTNKKGKVRSKNIQVSSISSSIRKSLYGWLDSNKLLVDFIKRTGVDGRLLEEEYEIYLKLKDADRFELQKKLLALVGYDEDEIESIISGATSNLLTNSSLLEHLKTCIGVDKNWSVDHMTILRMVNKKFVLPSAFIRPLCSNCGIELMGVLVYRRFKEDPDLIKHLDSICLCTECRSSAEG